MSNENKYGFKLLEIDNPDSGILAYSVDGGAISEDAVAEIWKRFEVAKAAGNKIRLYAEMSALPKASGRIVIEKLKRLGTIFKTIERMAIVGDADWIDVYARIVDPITKFDVKHFTTEQKNQAIAWIRE